MRDIVRILVTVLLLLVVSRPAGAQANDWLEPFPPCRIAGNLYYVGSRGLASYLVTTPRGRILINSDLEKGEQDVFVDREEYRKFVADQSSKFQAALQKQRAAATK